MYKKFSYHECETSLELIMRIAQNIMITYLEQDNIAQALEETKHISHKRLHNALTGNRIYLVARAFVDLLRYLITYEKDTTLLLSIIVTVVGSSIREYGNALHAKEQLRHGRQFK